MTTKPDAYYMVDFAGVYANTTANAANTFVSSGGLLLRSTSALKYKRDVEPIEPSRVDELVNAFADAAIWYRSACEYDNPAWGYYGLSADALAKSAPQFVHFGKTGEPEGVMYERVVVPLALKVRDLEARLAAVEAGSIAPPAPIVERVEVPVEVPVEAVPVGDSLPEVDPDAVPDVDPEAIPAVLASLANEGETAGAFFARMSPHLQMLLHRYVRGDKYSVDCLPLNDAEKIEFAETYAKNSASGNWLKVQMQVEAS